MRIIYFGTPDFSVAFLEALIAEGHIPVAVVSQPDKPQGRKHITEPTPVKKYAELHDIPILQPTNINTPETLEKIRVFQPDTIVVVAFGQILKQEILSLPRFGCINVHPSLLPKYRGAAPLQEAILHGDTETGVTIIQIDAKMDHGPILAQETLLLSSDETLSSLREKTTTLGSRLLIDVIKKIQDGAAQPHPQDDTLATYTRLLTRESGKIDWKK
ncbi:methionyl-tRNA formyltransferase, partial [Candidatus Uhrbacteria bacterium]|nr:methionyl-tRNA formyltransferase [Candidatus Uhrbacteria bacterium]